MQRGTGSAAVVLRRIWEFLVGRVMLSLFALVILLGTAYAFRIPLLRVTGDFLIREDPRVPCDAIYVLGGTPLERGTLAGQLLVQGMAPVAFCTGEAVPTTLLTLDLTLTEGELSRHAAIEAGADSSIVHALNVGTSTYEEAEAIIAHAQQAGYTNIMVISTEFHSRRVGKVFRKSARNSAVSVHVAVAASQRYDSVRWWESEEGMLMVNNEYMKLLYYWLRY